jgi:hypothetical protein
MTARGITLDRVLAMIPYLVLTRCPPTACTTVRAGCTGHPCRADTASMHGVCRDPPQIEATRQNLLVAVAKGATRFE